jgi:hypothetical protein
MTPKEKAIELVDKYYNYVNCWDEAGEADYKQAELYAKECALIAVNEMLRHIEVDKSPIRFLKCYTKEWWEQVVIEIDTLNEI